VRRIRWWLGLLALALTACGGGETAVDLGDPATLGQRTFDQWCVPCHGAEGEGFVNALNAPALNADGESHLLTDEEILHAIIDGGAASGGLMAPLGDQLTEEQERAVLEFVHSLWTDDQRAAHENNGGHIAATGE
jgi:mono/diheme cytochrome c family protein